MDAKFGIELGKAACKLNRNQAREMVIRLLEKYEHRISEPPEGDRYQDCYDAVSGKPGEKCIRLYDEVKEELGAMGIPFE
jgi:methylamine--corrinoid protein Co-methyltransferase